MHVYQRVLGDNGFTIFGMDPDLNDLPAMELETPLAMRITGALDGIRRVTRWVGMLPAGPSRSSARHKGIRRLAAGVDPDALLLQVFAN
jgi:hypothetical protein